ncbi:MAG: hypothetical protein Q8N03_15160 [Ignavibacteria bacterium]|jgi:hypothetical protein|nr:hypothetical protein [Ignavibacteria bacterium]
MNYQEKLNFLKTEKKMLLNFYKANYPVYHNSNLFFRDFQYSIKRFLEMRNYKTKYPEAESLAKELSLFLEGEGIFLKVNSLAWKLCFPEFQTGAPHTFEEKIN